jgi:hypothetical protein
MSPNTGGGGGGVGGSQPMSKAEKEAQINFGDLTPHLTYDVYIGMISRHWLFKKFFRKNQFFLTNHKYS